MVGKGTDLGASWPMTSASFFHPAATHQPCDFHWCFQPQAHRPGYWSFFSAGPGVFGKLSVILRKHSGYAEEYTHSCSNNFLVGIVGRLHFSKLGLHLARRPACSTSRASDSWRSCIFQYRAYSPRRHPTLRQSWWRPASRHLSVGFGAEGPTKGATMHSQESRSTGCKNLLKTRSHPDSQLKAMFIHFNPRNPASRDDYGHDLTGAMGLPG